MRFPGQRIAKHYFPVTQKVIRTEQKSHSQSKRWCLVGLDHVLVDMEVHGTAEILGDFGLVPGESTVMDETAFGALVSRLEKEGRSVTFAAGGTVANTLNNYIYLSGEHAILYGAIQKRIEVGQPAFHYVAQTPKAVDLNFLHPVDGPIGTAITFVGADGDRSFAVAPGVSNEVPPSTIDPEQVKNAAVVLTTQYCLRDPAQPIASAATRLMELAVDANVPVAYGLGTSALVRQERTGVRKILQQFVTVAAMNAQEAVALTGETDVLLATRMVLDWVDLVIITEGDKGMTMGGYVDEAYKRETDQEVRSKSIAEYNRWEYSRLMRVKDCRDPLKVYTHIHPYRGGPDRLSNTSGAGDAALAAVLHDISANQYHRATVPDSEKHAAPVSFLTYSSLSRNAQYGNRVAYEVLKRRSPRLDFPVRSDKPE